jgi:hypothetical protein
MCHSAADLTSLFSSLIAGQRDKVLPLTQFAMLTMPLRWLSRRCPELLSSLRIFSCAGLASVSFLGNPIGLSRAAYAQELKFPQFILIRYEAVNIETGGQFLIWVEREKIWYGLDPRLYPAAKSVEVTHITPAPGSTALTMIAVTRIHSTIPDYFHLSGNVRFKVSGMTIKASNLPGGQQSLSNPP